LEASTVGQGTLNQSTVETRAGSHLGRALAGGLLWLGILYVGDTLDSYYLIERGIKHVDADGATADMLRDAVFRYVGQIGLGYLFMGLVTAVLVHLVMRLWFPGPSSRLAWWRTALALGGLATLLGYARQILTFPPLHDWFFWRTQWVDMATPGEVAVVQVLVAALLVHWRWRAWGRRAPLVFGRRTAWLALAVAAVAGSQLRPAASPSHADAGPNIVLIGIDSLRPDHLSANGYERPTSPNIDALLSESVVFDSAWSQIARTYPSWSTLLTGSWPTDDGIRDNLPSPADLVPKQPTASQVLKEGGWYTAFATDDSRFSYMVPEMGWDRILQPPVSLTNFVVSANEPRYRAFHAFMHNRLGFAMVPSQRYNQAYGKSYRPQLFASAVLDELADASQHDRFFLAMHSCVLHHPGDRIWPYDRMFGQEGYDGDNRFRYATSPTSFEVAGEDGEGRAQDYAAQDKRIYDTGVVMADELVGDIMGSLRASGLLDNSIVILFSDHGEELWEPNLPYRYNGPNHGFHLMGSAQNHVVLSVRMPDGTGAGAGARVQDPVRLIDLGPTLADLVGLAWPGTADGRSMLPLVRGEHETRPRLVYMETGISEDRYWVPGHRDYPFHRVQERYAVDPATGHICLKDEFRPYLVAAKDRAVQVGRWKLVWSAVKRGTYVSLYDVLDDPLQRHDLSRQERDRVAWLGAKLAPFLRADGESPEVLNLWSQYAQGLDEDSLAGPAPTPDAVAPVPAPAPALMPVPFPAGVLLAP